MKLVLKYNNTVKLYTQDLNYQTLLDFIEHQFILRRETINITYIDDENDEIGVSTEDDLNILATISETKSYVKVNIKGELKSNSSSSSQHQNVKEKEKTEKKSEQINDQNRQSATNILPEIKPKKKEANVKPKKNEKKEEKEVKIKEKKVKSKEKKTQQIIKPKIQEVIDQNNSQEILKFNKLMAHAITTLVDERIQALVPCIREQVHQKDNISDKKWPKLIHQGIKCKSCSASPIIGILYSCPKCENFFLCSQCEQFYYHEHNMLKIKKEQNELKSNKIKKILNELYGMISNVQIKQIQQKPKNESLVINEDSKNKCKELKKVFGGKVTDYISFVENHSQMNMASVFEKYCQIKQLNQNESHKKYVEITCQQLATQFKTDPQSFVKFVEQNGCLEYKTLVKIYKDNLKKQQQKLKQQKKKQQKQQKQQKKQKKQNNKSKPKEILPLQQKNQQKQSEKIKYQCKDKKTEIFDLMAEIFGKERSNQYYDFIETHLDKGTEKIIELWSNNVSMLH